MIPMRGDLLKLSRGLPKTLGLAMGASTSSGRRADRPQVIVPDGRAAEPVSASRVESLLAPRGAIVERNAGLAAEFRARARTRTGGS